MLKNLFSKIKSEKSSTIKNDEPHQNEMKNAEQKHVQLSSEEEHKLGTRLSQQSTSFSSVVKGQIPQVRYWTTAQIPEIFTKVLSCPISHYNLLPHSKRKVKEIDLRKEKFPQYLNFMKPLLQKQLPTFNHLLINHYPKGIGIMHHFDGPMYKDKVVVLSLGGPALISFQEKYSKDSQAMKILLEDRSVHIFENDAYQKYLHGIEDNKVDAITFTIVRLKSVGEKELNLNMVKLQTNSPNDQLSYFIQQSSIRNINSATKIKQIIEKYLKRLTLQQIPSEQQQKYCFDFDQYQSYRRVKGCFVFIRPDCELGQGQFQEVKGELNQSERQSFRWKMQIQRQQRISITIREQYSKNL